MAPNEQKAEQLDKVFKHVKEHGQVPPDAPAAFQGLNPHELRLIAKLNDDLFDEGFGVSDEFRVSMV